MSLLEATAAVAMGTIWSSSPCTISVGMSNFFMSSLKSVHLRGDRPSLPLVVYLANPDNNPPSPPGSTGATHDPSELLHLVLDVLERVRL